MKESILMRAVFSMFDVLAILKKFKLVVPKAKMRDDISTPPLLKSLWIFLLFCH